MITVVLADDDIFIRESLRDLVPWNELGMEVVGIAQDGEDALRLCRMVRPDILLTDIKMPFLTGLEVAICLQEEEAHTRIVLISGIQDFNYAKTALSIQAAGYILKPIQIHEVLETLNKIRNTIELERNREQVLQRLSGQLSKNMLVMRDKFLSGLVLGEIQSTQEIRDKLEYFDLPFQARESIAVAVAEIDDYADIIKNRPVRYRQFLCFSVLSMIETTLANRHAGVCLSERDNEFIIIFNESTGFNDWDTQILDEVNELIPWLGPISISVGIGNRVASMEHTSVSYHNAQNALKHKFYTGKSAMIHIEDVLEMPERSMSNTKTEYSSMENMLQCIVSHIQFGDSHILRGLLDEYFKTLRQTNPFMHHYTHSLCMELVTSVYQLGYKAKTGNSQLFERYTLILQAILTAETVDAMQSRISEFILHIADFFHNEYDKKNNDLVLRIKKYVEEQIMENIQLADIAAQVFLSPNYICSIFKKETGETINEYIIRLKMSKAKQMLSDSKMKIWEIAEQLGYENPHYFSYSFKKHTGQTPQQYRGKDT